MENQCFGHLGSTFVGFALFGPHYKNENKIMFSSAAATATYKNRLWHFIFLFPSDRINPMFYFEKSEFLSTKSSGVSCGHSPGLWG